MKLVKVLMSQVGIAMDMINMAKKHLKEQGIDQWQSGYPDLACIENDIIHQKGYFIMQEDHILGYVCIDFEGEPAYDDLNGTWSSNEAYVVVHRMALSDDARGKKITSSIFALVEQLSAQRNIRYFRLDTDKDNLKMRHVLQKNGFGYCGTIWFDHSEKIAFDKLF